MGLIDFWPLFGLRIVTPRLTLRVPTDSDLEHLADLVGGGIHDPSSMPFAVAWTDVPSPQLERQALQYWWRQRAEFSTDSWSLMFVIEVDGQLVGVQDLMAKDFPTLRTAETGSWLGQAYQRQGLGKEMRAAVVAFAFEQLDALAVTSGAFSDNIASQKVSEGVGYERNGVSFHRQRDRRGTTVRYLLTRERWDQAGLHPPITVDGFERCRELFFPDQSATRKSAR